MLIYTHPAIPGFYKHSHSVNNLVANKIDSIQAYIEFGLPESLLFGASRVALSARSEIEFLSLEQEPSFDSNLEDIRTVFSFLKGNSDFDIIFDTLATAECADRLKALISTASKSPKIDICAWFDDENNTFWSLRHYSEDQKKIQIRVDSCGNKFTLAVLEIAPGANYDPSFDSLELVANKVLFQKHASDTDQYRIIEERPNREVIEHPIPLHLLTPSELRMLAEHMERVDEEISIHHPFLLDDAHPVLSNEFSLVGCDTHFKDFRGAILVQDKGVIIRANKRQYLVPKFEFPSISEMEDFFNVLTQIQSKA